MLQDTYCKAGGIPISISTDVLCTCVYEGTDTSNQADDSWIVTYYVTVVAFLEKNLVKSHQHALVWGDFNELHLESETKMPFFGQKIFFFRNRFTRV